MAQTWECRCKIVVLGDPETGKTALAQRIRHGKFVDAVGTKSSLYDTVYYETLLKDGTLAKASKQTTCMISVLPIPRLI